MSKPIARYQIKVDRELGLTITPYLYTKFWANHIEICHDCGTLKFSPIDDRLSHHPDDWPKVIKIPLTRVVVFDMEGDED